MKRVHTFPLNDLVEHNTDSDECICGPDIEFVGGGVHVIHHSLDARELAERNPERFRRLTCCGLVVDTMHPARPIRWDVIDGEGQFWHKDCPSAKA